MTSAALPAPTATGGYGAVVDAPVNSSTVNPRLPQTKWPRRVLVTESILVLGVGLGAAAVYAVLNILARLASPVPLGEQSSGLNAAVTPQLPWLDLAYQLARVVLPVIPAILALHLLVRDDPRARQLIGADLRQPVRDLLTGAAVALTIGLPGLALYLLARHLGLNTTVSAASLGAVWWAVPVLILAACSNAVLEEVTMVGYLFTRWRQAGFTVAGIVVTSALIRGTYHLYQGFGGFVGNIAMGLLCGLVYLKTGRLAPLIVAHALLDIVAFLGYAWLSGRVSWL